MRQFLDKDGLKRYHFNVIENFANKNDIIGILEKIDDMKSDIDSNTKNIVSTNNDTNIIKENIGYDDLNISFKGFKNISDCTTIIDALRVLDEIIYRLRFKDEPVNNNLFYIKSLEENNVVYNSTIICRLSEHSKDVEYSYDGVSWYNLSSVENITLDKNEHVYFRYIYNYITDEHLSYIEKENIGILTETTKTFDIGGDIRTIIYGNNTKKNVSYKELCGLFSKTKIVNANELLMPFEQIEKNGCKNMFYGCSSLTTAPELPATTLGESCYYHMFQGCSSLTTAPELPATTLTTSCYEYMFYGCSSLTTAPELPATKLAVNCYYSMFDSCSSLTTAPELPAETLYSGCYMYMFVNCSKLNYIKMLAKNVDDSFLYHWVSGVSSTGTFVKYKYLTMETGINGIPTGWVVEEV